VRIRRLHRFLLPLLLVGALAAIGVFVSDIDALQVLAVACLVVALITWSFILEPLFHCPACRNYLQQTLGSYCPPCGAKSLRPAGLISPARCMACGQTFSFRRGKRYTIRHCTHCGVMLDEKGV